MRAKRARQTPSSATATLHRGREALNLRSAGHAASKARLVGVRQLAHPETCYLNGTRACR